MGSQTVTLDWEAEKSQWLNRLRKLTSQIVKWAEAEGWMVRVLQKDMEEKPLGAYTAPTVHIRTANGNLVVDPICWSAYGAQGRVDLMEFPSYDRIMLLYQKDAWRVTTDSGVVLPLPWPRETFVKLANQLTKPR
jgi:hypothetical protein